MTPADPADPADRVQAGMDRLSRLMAGETVPEAVDAIDKAVDWYAADVLTQLREYFVRVREDLTARVQGGGPPTPAPEDPECDRHRAEFADALAAGAFRVWLSGPDNPDKFDEIASLEDFACPGCGAVPPRLDDHIVRLGRTLSNRPGRRPGARPDPTRRGAIPCPAGGAPRGTVQCACGHEFKYVYTFTSSRAAYRDGEE